MQPIPCSMKILNTNIWQIAWNMKGWISKYHRKWQVLVPNCCKYNANDIPGHQGSIKQGQGSNKNKVGGQKTMVVGQKNMVGGQKDKVGVKKTRWGGGQRNKIAVKKTGWGVRKTGCPTTMCAVQGQQQTLLCWLAPRLRFFKLTP